jgi:ankyrin repeat protein
MQDRPAMAKLVRHGLHANYQDSGGRTPLMFFAQAGAVEDLTFLLSRGAEPNRRTHHLLGGHTALMMARFAPQPSRLGSVRLLLEAGADAKACDAESQSVLMTWLQAPCDDLQEIVKLLLSHGARVFWRDADGRSTLDLVTALQRDLGWSGFTPIRQILWRHLKIEAARRPVQAPQDRRRTMPTTP